VALEADKEIFDAVLLPMKKIIPVVVATEVTQAPPLVESSEDPDAMTVVLQKFVRKDRPSK
jgi:hypothetical protein